MPFYAVQKGFRPGVYKTWAECEQMVKGFSGAKYKKFNSEAEAHDFAFPNEAKGSSVTANNRKATQNKKDIPYKYDDSIQIEEGTFQSYGNYVLYEIPFKDKNCSGKLFVHGGGIICAAIDGVDYWNTYGLPLDEIGYVCIKNDIEDKLGYSLPVLEKAIRAKYKEEYGEYEDFEDYVKSMEGGTVYIYVDGSYNEKTNKYGYGVYMKKENSDFEQIYTGSDTCVEKGRNVEGEVRAATVGLLKAKELGFKNVVVCYDYEGIAMWGTGAWKTNKGYTTKYAAFVKNLFDKEDMNIVFNHTKGHSGNKGNEYVDKLAKIACDVPITSGDRAFVSELQNVPGFPGFSDYEEEQEGYEI